jgi:hypothetical protein
VRPEPVQRETSLDLTDAKPVVPSALMLVPTAGEITRRTYGVPATVASASSTVA